MIWLQGRAEIGAGEIVAFEQQRQVALCGERVGEAVAEVQPRRVVALTEAAVGIAGDPVRG